MGEYYDWVNVDRKEYICPNDFDLGNKSHESMGRGNVLLRALRELLSREWKGDHVLFLGDESPIPADTENETLRILYGHTVQAGYPGHALETMLDTYRNVSGLFKQAETEVRQEILYYLEDRNSDAPILSNEYGVDPADPFAGLFLREGRDLRYTINHSKRVCYSFDQTRILQLDRTANDRSDPLPLLMMFGGWGSETGAWTGDVIGVSDEKPEGCVLLDEICLDW